MTRPRRIVRLLTAVPALLLAGCDIHRGSPRAADGSGWGLATPPKLAAFERVDQPQPASNTPGLTAGYSHVVDGEPVVATIRVRAMPGGGTLLPAVDLGGGGMTAAAAATALDASLAQVRRYYPKATTLAQGPAFLLQRGALQPGQTATVEYQELHGGRLRPMRLTIYTFCCGDGRWSYEYRFRHPASLDDHAEIVEFMRQSAWTATPP